MSKRSLSNQHVKIGWTATSESANVKKKEITEIATCPTTMGGWDAVAVTVTSEGKKSVLYLTTNGAVELVKSLLIAINDNRGGPVSLLVDDEFRSILDQTEAGMKKEEENAQAVVNAVLNKNAL